MIPTYPMTDKCLNNDFCEYCDEVIEKGAIRIDDGILYHDYCFEENRWLFELLDEKVFKDFN